MKTDRLLAETIYLLQRGRVTSRQMAERFEVSRRTILRDMDALSLAGIPVTSLDGAGGGYQLEESYRFDHRAADRQDVELILVALRALSTAMDDLHLQSAIEKFQPLEKESGAEPLSVDLSVLNESARVQRNLRALRRAIREKSVVRITYVSAAGREAMHEVEPLRLDYRWYAWYLTAWSRRHDKPVTFKLIRMDGVEPTGERCPERPPVELPEDSRSMMKASGKTVPLHIELQAYTADRLTQILWGLSNDTRTVPSVLADLHGLSADSDTDVQSYDSPEEFEAALAALKGGG